MTEDKEGKMWLAVSVLTVLTTVAIGLIIYLGKRWGIL